MDPSATSDKVDWQIRLEIPVKKTLDYNYLKAKPICAQLECLLQQLDVDFNVVNTQSGLVDGDFIDTVEYIVLVTPKTNSNVCLDSDDTPRSLVQAISLFFQQWKLMIRKWYDGEWDGASVIIYSTQWFINEISSCSQNVPLSVLDFGTFCRSKFNSHWEVIGNRHSGRYNEDHEIAVDFLFDQNQVIMKFWHMEFLHDRTEQRAKVRHWTHYKVQVLMQNIRRIVLDININENSPDALYLDLINPPIVKRATDPKKESVGERPYKRWVKIKRGPESLKTARNGSELFNDRAPGSSEQVLVENTTLRLELAEKSSHMNDFWQIVSRLRHRCNVPIEFQSLEVVNSPEYMHSFIRNPYCSREDIYLSSRTDSPATHPDSKIFKQFVYSTFGDPKITMEMDLQTQNRHLIHYLLEALLSRGAVVKDHLLLYHGHNDPWTRFLSLISESYKKHPGACIEALKRLMTAVDEQKRLYNVHDAYQLLFEKCRLSDENGCLSEDKMLEGYMLVPRVVVTLTRHIRIQPEMCMGNRVLRSRMGNDPSVILRISFRDDDNTMPRLTKTSDYLLERCIRDAFDNGLYIAGRRYYYLGSSSSQMRECGAYFMVGVTTSDLLQYRQKYPDVEAVVDPRLSVNLYTHSLGRFNTLKTAPKIMARLGQCFTQSRESKVMLQRQDYTTVADIIGGRKQLSPHGHYLFTDGVGSMSLKFAQEMAKDMKLNSPPSCFQYRFRGHKGVQVVDMYLEDVSNWARKHKIPVPPPQKDIPGTWDISLLFRPSQIKFSAKRFKEQPMEIVKFSGPTPLCLNKPLINIFDQITGKQSYECHQRVTERIQTLLNIQVRNIIRMLLEERYCRNKLKELPKRIDVDRLRQTSGFELCCEPFFASLLRASVRYTILKSWRKLQIQIPASLGRSLLGVNDVSNRLQYGQIFVQYTNDIGDYSPHPNAAKTIVTGRVMVTKNPTSVGGDLRVLEAVDIPELHHLVDVIVFPVHGPRPLPDQMAGSDLDGDEYSVMWDPQLLIDRNVEPATYELPPQNIPEVTKDNFQTSIRDAFIDYVKKDNIGSISNALLFQSDLYGIDSQVVQNLAAKAVLALDFLKSGIAPERLRDKWSKVDEDDSDSEWLPPEKPERYPDFHIANEFCPIYHSPRLIGKLFRETKMIEDVLKMVEESDTGKELDLDPLLEFDGWTSYEKKVKEAMDTYNGKLKMVMETYGITTEAEIISGCVVDMRSRVTDKDTDDFSYYNQRMAIESRVTDIMRETRQQFFEEFGGWKICTAEEDYRDVDNVFRRKCTHMTDEVKKKASAYYMVTYKKYKHHRSGQTRMLSFAWLIFDVLGEIRTQKAYYDPNFVTFDRPILRVLQDRITEVNDTFKNKRNSFQNRRMMDKVLKTYCTKYEGLDDLLFTIEEWARFNKYPTDHFTDTHLLYLFILFATGRFGSTSRGSMSMLDWVDLRSSTDELLDGKRVIVLREKADILLNFFEFLSSRKFKTLKHLTFIELGMCSNFFRGEWLPIHQAGFKTFLTIAFSMNFDDLGLNKSSNLRPKILRELDPFIIELPPAADLRDVERRLIKATGVTEVKLRNITTRGRNDRAVVVCRGQLEACYKLKELVAVRPALHIKYSAKELSDILPEIMLQTIIKASESVVEV